MKSITLLLTEEYSITSLQQIPWDQGEGVHLKKKKKMYAKV